MPLCPGCNEPRLMDVEVAPEIGKDVPCVNCQLIEMGEMDYQEICSNCGRLLPTRSRVY